MDKNKGFTDPPNPISDLKPSGEDIVNRNIPVISSTINNNSQSRQLVNESNTPFRNIRKGKHKIIPNSDDFVDSDATLTMNNDQPINSLQAQNTQNEDESKNATKVHDHIASDRVTNVDSNTEQRLANIESDPIQARSKVRMRENDLERERQDVKKVKLENDFEDQQLIKATAVPVQPKLKEFRMREHELDQERQAVKKILF
ncbi:824_t:CDS:2 [Funneliformis geosporum]|nr:824_t:CDS:2 [Funneliformis geosporum]